MTGAQGDPRKWTLPGWRIEQKYTDQTLVGNWYEQRKAVCTFLYHKFCLCIITIFFECYMFVL